jgi:PadR family transcriptional regulator PadR
LYPLLTRLKNAEFLTYRWIESNSGPPANIFHSPKKGAAFYKELEATWNELANAVKALSDAEQDIRRQETCEQDILITTSTTLNKKV